MYFYTDNQHQPFSFLMYREFPCITDATQTQSKVLEQQHKDPWKLLPWYGAQTSMTSHIKLGPPISFSKDTELYFADVIVEQTFLTTIYPTCFFQH